MTDFIDRFERALSARDMTARDVSRMTGINESSLSQWRSGRCEPKREGLIAIAKALDVSVEWLMGEDVPMEKEKAEAPMSAGLSDRERLFLKLFDQISEEGQEAVLQALVDRLKSDK